MVFIKQKHALLVLIIIKMAYSKISYEKAL